MKFVIIIIIIKITTYVFDKTVWIDESIFADPFHINLIVYLTT